MAAAESFIVIITASGFRLAILVERAEKSVSAIMALSSAMKVTLPSSTERMTLVCAAAPSLSRLATVMMVLGLTVSKV